MADLSSLIRLAKHELDAKRRALAALYSEHLELEARLSDIEWQLEAEKAAVDLSGDVHFTFAAYAAAAAERKQQLLKEMAALESRIVAAKDDMLDTFSEMKKYEMTQAERERIEEEERAFRESLALDEIGLESYRRRDKN